MPKTKATKPTATIALMTPVERVSRSVSRTKPGKAKVELSPIRSLPSPVSNTQPGGATADLAPKLAVPPRASKSRRGHQATDAQCPHAASGVVLSSRDTHWTSDDPTNIPPDGCHLGRATQSGTAPSGDDITPGHTSGVCHSHPAGLNERGDQVPSVHQTCSVAAQPGRTAGNDQPRREETPMPACHPAVPIIREKYARRKFTIRQRNSIESNLKAFARLMIGFSAYDTPESRKAKCELAAKMVKAVLEGKAVEAAPEVAAAVTTYVDGFRDTVNWLNSELKRYDKELTKLAETLPVWKTFGKPTKGFGAIGLAIIVGECGDLSNYSNPAKVWKRMRLHVEEGKAVVGGPRRSAMFTIGDAMLKQGESYRQLYLDRKVHEATRTTTKMHAHRRAQRYMEKRLLRDLWAAWRGVREDGHD